MRAITLLSAIGLLATASLANAAAPESPPSLRPVLDCWLKDHDWDQKEDLRCRVKVFLNTATAPDAEPNVAPEPRETPTSPPTPSRRVLVVDCDRHKKLVTHDFVIGENNDLWISAKEHRTLVSMRVEGIGARPTQNNEEPHKLRANLLLANEILRKVDGFCKYSPPGPQPIPAQ